MKITVAGGKPVEASTEVSKKLTFAPLERPRSGVLEACARIRDGMALLDKYLSAIERDVKILEPGDHDDLPWGTEAVPQDPRIAEENEIIRLRRVAAELRAKREAQ